VVEVVGETVCDPFRATVAPFRSALTALVVLHVSVELPPDAIEVGLALIPAAGGPLEPTVTVAWADAVAPDELLLTKVYVVVDVGETDCDPLTATDAPFRVALTAFVDVQVSVELPPDVIEVGLALIVAVGPVEPTVTVAWAVAVAPEELLAMKV
jgi:flagellar biosynthesis protein FliP